MTRAEWVTAWRVAREWRGGSHPAAVLTMADLRARCALLGRGAPRWQWAGVGAGWRTRAAAWEALGRRRSRRELAHRLSNGPELRAWSDFVEVHRPLVRVELAARGGRW